MLITTICKSITRRPSTARKSLSRWAFRPSPRLHPLDDALYYWRVQAVDTAGNASGWTLAWNVRVDAVATPGPVLSAPS